MNQFFITGTDTGVGKTVTSAILTHALNASYWKPIQSGIADEISEEQKIKNWIDLDDDRIIPSCYTLQASLSPDQAAKLENIQIELSHINKPAIHTPLIVEGAGGVFVPLNQHQTMLDLMQKLQLPVIVVARGTLGTINHTLLTLEALRSRDIHVHGVIFSGALNPDNQHAIEKWGKVKTLMHIPHFKEIKFEVIQRYVSTLQV